MLYLNVAVAIRKEYTPYAYNGGTHFNIIRHFFTQLTHHRRVYDLKTGKWVKGSYDVNYPNFLPEKKNIIQNQKKFLSVLPENIQAFVAHVKNEKARLTLGNQLNFLNEATYFFYQDNTEPFIETCLDYCDQHNIPTCDLDSYPELLHHLGVFFGVSPEKNSS